MVLTHGHCYGICKLICLNILRRHTLAPRLMLDGLCHLPSLFRQVLLLCWRYHAACVMPLTFLCCLLCLWLLYILWACLSSHVLACSAWLHRIKLFQHTDAIFASAELVVNYVASVHLWFDSHPCLLLHSHRCDTLCRSSRRNSRFLGCQCLSFSRCDRSSRCYSCSCPQVLVR